MSPLSRKYRVFIASRWVDVAIIVCLWGLVILWM